MTILITYYVSMSLAVLQGYIAKKKVLGLKDLANVLIAPFVFPLLFIKTLWKNIAQD